MLESAVQTAFYVFGFDLMNDDDNIEFKTSSKIRRQNNRYGSSLQDRRTSFIFKTELFEVSKVEMAEHSYSLTTSFFSLFSPLEGKGKTHPYVWQELFRFAPTELSSSFSKYLPISPLSFGIRMTVRKGRLLECHASNVTCLMLVRRGSCLEGPRLIERKESGQKRSSLFLVSLLSFHFSLVECNFFFQRESSGRMFYCSFEQSFSSNLGS
jgi:hypothetical protein